MRKIKISTVLSLVLVLTACSFVSLSPAAKNVSVSNSIDSFNNCKYLGDTNVSIWSKADTFQSDKSVESQLDVLARNEAATMNGNKVVAKTAIDNGKRTYGVYSCLTNIESQ